MIEAGGLTIGGVLVLLGWGMFRAIIWFGDYMADEIGRFFDVRGAWAGEGAADDHAAVDDGQCLHAGMPPSTSAPGTSVVGIDPETILAASGNSLSFTGERTDA